MAAKEPKQSTDAERPAWMLTEQEIEDYFAEFGPVRILIAGSREWTNRRAIAGSLRRALKFLKREAEHATVIHGGSQGADREAESIAIELGLRIRVEHPMWDSLSAGKPKLEGDILLAFIRDREPEPTKLLKRWLKDDRPAILCSQDGDGAIKGKFFNMDRD